MPSLTTADGRTLAWRELGSGPVLVCHPGGPGSSSAYFGDLPELAARRALVLLDPRGTGGSDRPADPSGYDLEQYVADVEALREHLGNERLDLLGHSHGGFVAMAWAGAHPERVGRLVLASTAPRFIDEIRDAQRQRIGSHHGQPYFDDAMAALQAHQRGEYADDEELGDVRRRESRLFAPVGTDPSAIAAVGQTLARAGMNADALRHFNERIAGTMDLRPQLTRVASPTLVIGGDQDSFTPGLLEAATVLPDPTVVVLQGHDHFPFLEGPEHRAQWCSAVLEFLDAAA
jgi:pimeloyl-ACP methyl ester carboxylesterase